MLDLPENATLVGIDYGLKRTGVCLGNVLTKTTSPLTTIKHVDKNHFLSQLGCLIEVWQPQLIVVGCPTSNKVMAKHCQSIAADIERMCKTRCLIHEEDLSSWEAEHYLKQQISINRDNKFLVDRVSAQIILQSFINEYLG